MNDYIAKLDLIEDQYHSANMPDMFIENIAQQYTLDWLFENLAGRKSVLELGYGDGIINSALVKGGIDVEVIEGSPKIIARARSVDPQIRIRQSLFEEFSPDCTYDCILALHVLEHMDDPVAVLAGMKNWLKPNGQILLIVPNRNSLHRQLAVEMGLQTKTDDLSPRDKLVGHQRVYSHHTLRSDVEAAGFKVVSETGFFLKTLPNGMMLEHSHQLIWAMNRLSSRLPRELMANIGMVIEPI